MAVKVGQRKDKPGWWVFIHYRGKRTKRCFGEGRAGERKAIAFADKMKARLEWADASGEVVALKRADQMMPTVAEYLRDWLTTYAKVNCKLSTYEEYQRAVEGALIPALGMKPIDGLKRDTSRPSLQGGLTAGSLVPRSVITSRP